MVESRVSDEELGVNRECWLRNEQWHIKNKIPQDIRGRLELDLFDARTQAASDADEIARLKEQLAGPTFADAVAAVEKYRIAARHSPAHTTAAKEILRDLQALASERE